MIATADMSLEHQVSLMDPADREQMLAGIDLDELAYDWSWNGRPSQILPVLPTEGGDEWTLTMALAGRGFG